MKVLTAVEAAQMIVVGRRSHSWLSRPFEPAVSEYVMRNAECPVLFVKEQSVGD
jgi:nucleotide-binding universal stress UspA family protein